MLEYIQSNDYSTKVETHLSIKLSKKNFGILRPNTVRRTLVIGLIYGSRANKQFDIAYIESSELCQAFYGTQTA